MADVGRYLILVEFSRIVKSVKSNKFLRCRVDISGNLRLINFSGFPRFKFRVKMVRYKIFLHAIRGGK